ncbi:eukaryotic translation initiation factor 2 alpha subunit, putative [Plasmodium knowlesi strain H]|uniref:Eukaryotic translation initiation factor 2 subunit 1 n=3 Tax=Plasmodium knowlesi TaxID=5850 RepID=A0A5K1U7L8_PLAKH|nr:eukaryotic translation initiation factor 2 subunit alpha, putative [Plasmodium knowlesi strain H]OTN66393.1 putative Eukaryotic translation initiation factor 2 alpha subunit [Plasmodium knowlesi]CAA9986392.1 eukaryotic translation initiation factor 2 subunit alpha, putative [Plasmodium knowlesi strain H]SBO25661.1 eukaryotic translation initiation factor 2 alpha subunit, putative [Plasmodium knowlesi strain H]SBO28377.1 eukaryotic translation initiation factor 2 alpha subunit, putative [Plas|eukprot:XP_002257798.1 eukaryotic translation initiation factor 2 alpha subunit, putative [Plasmodium knowlesi strain H]
MGDLLRSKADLGDCRFYEKKFPEVDDLIMVKVNRIEDMGAYVSILEYNDMEGMILMSELSKRRFRSVNKLIRVGRHEVVLVLRVDSQKGYIDLSKRRVSPKDILKCEEHFSKSKKVHQTVRHVAQKHNMTVEELNRIAIWPLYKKYGHALDALKEATVNPEAVFKGIELNEDVKNSLMADIQLRLAAQALKLRGRIDVWCFSYEGIDAVKEALKKGKEVSNDEVSINIKLIAPPQYVIVTSCQDKDLGMAKIQEAMKVISDKIKEYKGGDFKQQGEILVIGGDDEKRLEELLDKQDDLSSDNEYNSSDDDDENSSDDEENSSDIEEEED